MFLRKILRKIKLKVYDQKSLFSDVSEKFTLLFSILTLSLITINFGFDKLLISKLNISLILISSIFYCLIFFFKSILYINIISFLKNNIVRTLIILFILLDLTKTLFHDFSFYNQKYKYLIFLFINLYFLFNSLKVLSKKFSLNQNKHISPAKLLVLSFLFLIFFGTILLMMPEAASNNNSINFFDALFTSISASCVTGLTVIDTATAFSEKGHMIIMALIQLGGINIIAFATLFALFSRAGGGIKQQQIISENFNSKTLLSGKSLLKKVLIFSVLIELIGALLIFLFTNFESSDNKIFDSLFHSVSAFNNAGFTISNYFEHSINLKITLSILIFLGAIGFPTLSDLSKNINSNKRLKWVKLHLTTRISLITSLLLIIFGTITFLALESGVGGESTLEKIVNGFFHSTSARTAGFNTIDFSNFSNYAILIIFIFLMFIGASPGSTGGGIKTNTFTLLFYSSLATLRGKKNIEIGTRQISENLIHKSYVIFLFSLLIIFFGWVMLLISERNLIDPINLLFEQVSAYSTVGLSVGETTNNLSFYGKIIIMITMFLGRIGTLLMAFSLMQKKQKANYQYPEAHLMVG